MRESSLAKSFIALLVLSSLVMAQSSMLTALQSYYQYSKEENQNAYFDIMDLSEFSDQQIQLRKDTVSELWSRFDTLDYALSNMHEYSKDDFGIIEYHLNATIRGPDENGEQGQFSYGDDFVATMHQIGGVWKVNNVQQADVFAANMENLFLDSQTDTINEINEEAVESIDAQLPGVVETTATQRTDNEVPIGTKPTICLGGFLIAGTGLMAYLSGMKRRKR